VPKEAGDLFLIPLILKTAASHPFFYQEKPRQHPSDSQQNPVTAVNSVGPLTPVADIGSRVGWRYGIRDTGYGMRDTGPSVSVIRYGLTRTELVLKGFFFPPHSYLSLSTNLHGFLTFLFLRAP
jgi:hypothetical protein